MVLIFWVIRMWHLILPVDKVQNLSRSILFAVIRSRNMMQNWQSIWIGCVVSGTFSSWAVCGLSIHSTFQTEAWKRI